MRSHDRSGVGQAPHHWDSGGCLKLKEISPSVCQVSLGIGLDDRGNAGSIAFMACQSVSAMMMRNTCKDGCPIIIILNALIQKA